mgnify:CR=1 FL=1
MSHPLRTLGKAALDGLVEALAAGRLGTPLARAALVPHVPKEHLAAVWTALQELERDGMAPRHMARMLALLAEERGAGQRMSDRVELVWSPPELDAVDAPFPRPDWLGREITDEVRFYNLRLAETPFSTWPDRAALIEEIAC